MYSKQGFILVTTLVLMVILSLLTIPVLIQTELSQNMAGNAQHQFQLTQTTNLQHDKSLAQLKAGDVESAFFIQAPCPALYAAWGEMAFSCEWYQVRTTQQMMTQRHTITSFLVRQQWPAGGQDEIR